MYTYVSVVEGPLHKNVHEIHNLKLNNADLPLHLKNDQILSWICGNSNSEKQNGERGNTTGLLTIV